ncbi:MAG: tyrosine--tRNA ligase [Planctomycetota bacterium]
MTTREPQDVLPELQWRGLLHQAVDPEGLSRHLTSGQRLVYAGFDPTADSLTIGNLVPIMVLKHFQRAGHTPVVLAGGGTGLIGDPSGKTAERQLLDRERVAANVAAQSAIFRRVLEFDGPTAAVTVNNADWLTELSYIGVLRDVGKHFSVNAMIERDSVKSRLTTREQGISYTEFSYMVLQAYDFFHLHREHGVTIQAGGSDQWGNIVAGTELIRKSAALGGGSAETFAVTAPLVTKADGGKFGKTEEGAVWLSPERTSPYAYYQFWLNVADADAGPFLRMFTLLSRDEIEALEAAHAETPGRRGGQRALARAATSVLYGEPAMEEAEAAGKALFSGELSGLSEAMLDEVLSAVPSSTRRKDTIADTDLVDLLVETGLAKSKRESREFLQNGSVSVNGQKADADRRLSANDLLHGSVVALRRGKKAWHVTRWA